MNLLPRTTFDGVFQNRLVRHLMFWMGFWLLFIVLAALNTGDVFEHFVSYSVLLPVQMCAGYLLVYYQVPSILLKRKYLTFIVFFLVSVYGFSTLGRLANIYLAEPLFREEYIQESVYEVIMDPFFLMSVYFPAVYVIVFLMLAIKIVKDKIEDRHQIELLEKEKISTELKFLKAQINPHFLFNTLNNLYALTLTKSDLAPEVVLKLSEMLDYMLYECNVPRVPMQKEIELIEHYISLEQLRFGDRLVVQLQKEILNKRAEIAPLLLVTLVENAFKHVGLTNKIGKPTISIELKIDDSVVSFLIRNTKKHLKTGNLEKEQIGNQNIKRQLMLNYPTSHQYEEIENEEEYQVKLKITLEKK